MRHLRLVHSVTLSHAPVDDRPRRSGGHSLPDQDAATHEREPSRVGGGRTKVERADRPFDPAVQALLEHVRIVGPLPLAVRERALARARAALAAPACTMARSSSFRQRRPWLTLLVWVTLAGAVGAAVEALLTRGFA